MNGSIVMRRGCVSRIVFGVAIRRVIRRWGGGDLSVMLVTVDWSDSIAIVRVLCVCTRGR